MEILRKLLGNLGDVWNTLPKDIPFISISQGTGSYTLVSVDNGALYFHSAPFRSDLPLKQVITLDGLTTSDLTGTISSMGYVVTVTSEAPAAGINASAPIILMEVQNVPLSATLTAYTSNLWRVMYPAYRVLRNAVFDTEVALKEMYRDLADGEWLDFWASFFSITRNPGEADGDLVRRFTMWLFNPKTNNIAIKELLAYQLQDTNFTVNDRTTPLQFEVVVGTKYLSNNTALQNILMQTKAAGIEYFLTFLADTYSEDYEQYVSDATGRAFSSSDMDTIQLTISTLAEVYGAPSEAYSESLQASASEVYVTPPQTNIDGAFTLRGKSSLRDTSGASGIYDRSAAKQLQDFAVITVTVGGTTTKTFEV